ncbi:MAG: spore protease YyaC [Lachnospiraceae bacterium]|nr:spore protease YyaC [Lachnospiraceae bacterium]
MKFWERIAVQAQQEIYYYDTHRGFDARNLAGRLYEMILDELERGKKGVVFLCIGTDRSTGDSLGPLIGYKLKGRQNQDIQVFGTLERPVHAMNLDDYMHFLQEDYSDHAVVAIDASVGKSDHVGYVTLGRGALKPGLGVSKELRAVGDIFITGIVGGCGNYDPWMLQSVRLAVVMRLADCISESICLVEKLCANTAVV